MHRHRENTCGCQGRRVGQEKDWEFGVIRCKLFYAGWKDQKGLQYSTGKYMQYSEKPIWEHNLKKNSYIKVETSHC